MKTKDIGIYCHIPFCLKKCAYCDFYSGCFYEYADRFVDAIINEASIYAGHYPELKVSTVYFGGGTPSSLSSIQLEKLIKGVLSLFQIDADAEITLEANPATLDVEKLTILKKCGINRLSMGVQSSDNQELSTLSRLHTYEEFLETYTLTKSYIGNISLDLMYGLPDQTLDSFERSLRDIISLNPAHISLYALKIEPDTPFYHMADRLNLPSDDTVAEMYLLAHTILESEGYRQYEISNYAKQGSFSRHNLRYWQGKEYLGLGPSAHSYYDNVRDANISDITSYLEALERGFLPERVEREILDKSDLMEEAILLSMRLVSGLDLKSLQKCFHYDLLKEKGRLIESYCKEGFLKCQNDKLSFTTKGFLVSNTIISELLPD